MDELALIRPRVEYANELAEYRREFIEQGSSMGGCGSLIQATDVMEYIKLCAAYEQGRELTKGHVPSTQFMLVRKADERLLGMLDVRHYFNDYLKNFAGNIGYSVRPSERRKGYAKTMLRMALPYCREIGLDRVLICCLDGNLASERTILANGGVYESTIYEPVEREYLKRFWIEL